MQTAVQPARENEAALNRAARPRKSAVDDGSHRALVMTAECNAKPN